MSPRGEDWTERTGHRQRTGRPRIPAGPGRPLLPDGLLVAARSNQPWARARLVEMLLPLIASVARTYRRVPGVDRAELVQEGVVGMLRALQRYDPQVGAPFWAYASWWVRDAMQQLVSELSRPVVLSDRALRQLALVRATRRAFARAHAREPTAAELATATGLSAQQLQRLVAAERLPRALGQEVLGEDSSGTVNVGDRVADPCAEDAYDELATRLSAAQVPQLLEQLSQRERSVIEARYGLGGRPQPVSLRELGSAMGLSAERVRQIELTALGTLRSACSTSRRAAAGSRRPAPSTP